MIGNLGKLLESERHRQSEKVKQDEMSAAPGAVPMAGKPQDAKSRLEVTRDLGDRRNPKSESEPR